VASVFDDFGGDVIERPGERDQLLVGRMEEFCDMKDEQGGEKWIRGLTCQSRQ